MKAKFKSMRELTAYFMCEKRSKAFYEEVRWKGNITCPKCNHNKVYRTAYGYKCASSKCYRLFTVTTGTVFESTKLPLGIWLTSIYILETSKKGISSVQLSIQMDITQKSAWFLKHRIRESKKLGADFSFLVGIVEVDETYMGGKVANMHKHKKPKNAQGRSKYKPSIFGLLERGGRVRAFVTEDTYKRTIQKLIKENVSKDAIIMSDKYRAYWGLDKIFAGHHSVSHAQKEYVRQEGELSVHIQAMEGFWGLFKRGYFGIYHYMSKKHLQRYIDEFTFRYNTKDMNAMDRFMQSLELISKVRIRYKDLIKKK